MRVKLSVQILLPAAAMAALACSAQCAAQSQSRPQPSLVNPWSQSSAGEGSSDQPEQELQKGTALTRQGLFHEAIPHLKAAQGRVANEYAAEFNLALCYVGTREFTNALQVLGQLKRAGRENAEIEDLSAQAYVGSGQPREALAALQKAAAIAPQNEKLYLFVADACMDQQDYPLGLRVIEMGLSNLPQSPRLHYARAMLLSQLDQFDQARADFELVARLAAGTEIAYLSAARKALLEGDVPQAIRAARASVEKGNASPALLTTLGESLLRSGAEPGQPEFAEARAALEKSVGERPNDPSSQIALGRIYLMAGRLDDAIAHLEQARQLNPSQASVYANLARAYQRRGNSQAAQEALATLARLNEAQADRIRSAPGDRKMSYAGRETDMPPEPRR